MRVKTDKQRQAIMKAAAELFREAGYERATMTAIAARVGGSKATLYGYFGSKEDLFAAVMLEAMESNADRVFNMLDSSSDDLPTVLRRFCDAYLAFTLSAGILAHTRVGIAEGENSGLGRILYQRGPKAGWERVVRFIDEAMVNGKLRPGDPWIVALHLKGLVEAGLFEPRLFGAKTLFPRERAVDAAIDAFLRAYAIESP